MSGRVKIERSSGNVFTDLGFPRAEAENLILPSELMSEIREMARVMTHAKAAKCFGLTQPRLNDLLRGKIEKVSLDPLVKMIVAADLHVELRVGRSTTGSRRSLVQIDRTVGGAHNHQLKRCIYATAISRKISYFWGIGELCSASYLDLMARGHDIRDGLEAAMGKPANSDEVRGPPVTTAAAVADYLLWAARERGEPLSNLKLQKLLYYAQAWYLALNDRALFADDFQAWVHGPVLPAQYHRFKAAAWMPITEPVDEPALPEVVKAFLNEILDVFGVETAIALELMTHRERPWAEARRGLPPDASSNKVISKRSMRDFYRTMRAE